MIRKLRSRHRAFWLIAALPLLLLIVAGILAREETPLSKAQTLDYGDPIDSLEISSSASDLIEISIYKQDERFYLRSSQDRPSKKPDVLLYWSPSGAVADAWLLGPVGEGPRTYAVPPGQVEGKIVFYSLAHQEILARAAVDLGGYQ